VFEKHCFGQIGQIMVQYPAGAQDFSRLQNANAGSGTHPASYSKNAGGFYSEGKAAGV
jgi:hypothetical protein